MVTGKSRRFMDNVPPLKRDSKSIQRCCSATQFTGLCGNTIGPTFSVLLLKVQLPNRCSLQLSVHLLRSKSVASPLFLFAGTENGKSEGWPAFTTKWAQMPTMVSQ